MYCTHCQDIVKLFRDKRSCRCGKSWGHYLEDGSTTVQTWPSLSLGIADTDFEAAVQAWQESPEAFSPLTTMRAWINPASEPNAKYLRGDESVTLHHDDTATADGGFRYSGSADATFAVQRPDPGRQAVLKITRGGNILAGRWQKQ